jgi:hypothetical protein
MLTAGKPVAKLMLCGPFFLESASRERIFVVLKRETLFNPPIPNRSLDLSLRKLNLQVR